MSTTQINVRIDNQLKNDVELIFDKLGINTADAIRMFLKKVKLENGIPFSLKLGKENNDNYEPNEETRKAILNGEYEEISSINDMWL